MLTGIRTLFRPAFRTGTLTSTATSSKISHHRRSHQSLSQPQLRLCSSGSAGAAGSAWKKLNRVPTLHCLSKNAETLLFDESGSFIPEILALYRGNQRFRDIIARTTPDLLRDLAVQGQHPPFMLLDCSDSRVGEQVIFSAEPGTLFTTGNIANQFHEHDTNSHSVLSYAVGVLKVKHVIVMGHYGCGGVAAATLPRPSPSLTDSDTRTNVDPVQDWIQPIREIYLASERPEITAYRERKAHEVNRARAVGGAEGERLMEVANELPHLHEPAFRALVQENVKANVLRIANSTTIKNHYASLPNTREAKGVLIHGWIYDIEEGEVLDLDITLGPPGVSIPPSPFPLVRSGSLALGQSKPR